MSDSINATDGPVAVTGSAGYIGSHCVKQLKENGDNVVVLDNLFRGHIEAVPTDVPFEKIDLRDTAAVQEVLEKDRQIK